MEKIKLLLYCTKSKPYLVKEAFKGYMATNNLGVLEEEKERFILNGKIVAECDYEVIKNEGLIFDGCFNEETQLSLEQMALYTGVNDFYCIHIKNLHIFDKPRDIRNYYNIDARTMADYMNQKALLKAPQNMMYADYINIEKNIFRPYILISIRPEWLCKILNGEKTIEVRKKVLKEMIS